MNKNCRVSFCPNKSCEIEKQILYIIQNMEDNFMTYCMKCDSNIKYKKMHTL
jgi:hypothetical protein